MRILIALRPSPGQDFDQIGARLVQLRNIFPEITEVFESCGDMNFVILAEITNNSEVWLEKMAAMARAIDELKPDYMIVCNESRKL